MNQKETGNLGEKIAEKFLKKKGYQILDKNYSNKFISGPQTGEIDIVAQKGDTISFIEVKTLISKSAKNSRSWIFYQNGFSPEEKVNYQKQRKIIKTAEKWLIEKKIPLNSKWQIDVVSIKIDLNTKKAKIRHFKNIV
jgi:putative endonuclease